MLALVATVPAGRVTTHGEIARRLGMSPRLVATILARLSPYERRSIPWHRVVADGGAVGRHALSEEQVARLGGEGVAVAPAGIVEGLGERRHLLGAAVSPAVPEQPRAGGSRARGMKSRPRSSLGHGDNS